MDEVHRSTLGMENNLLKYSDLQYCCVQVYGALGDLFKALLMSVHFKIVEYHLIKPVQAAADGSEQRADFDKTAKGWEKHLHVPLTSLGMIPIKQGGQVSDLHTISAKYQR